MDQICDLENAEIDPTLASCLTAVSSANILLVSKTVITVLRAGGFLEYRYSPRNNAIACVRLRRYIEGR